MRSYVPRLYKFISLNNTVLFSLCTVVSCTASLGSKTSKELIIDFFDEHEHYVGQKKGKLPVDTTVDELKKKIAHIYTQFPLEEQVLCTEVDGSFIQPQSGTIEPFSQFVFCLKKSKPAVPTQPKLDDKAASLPPKFFGGVLVGLCVGGVLMYALYPKGNDSNAKQNKKKRKTARSL